jgi:hypothetical protein
VYMYIYFLKVPYINVWQRARAHTDTHIYKLRMNGEVVIYDLCILREANSKARFVCMLRNCNNHFVLSSTGTYLLVRLKFDPGNAELKRYLYFVPLINFKFAILFQKMNVNGPSYS